MTKKHLSQASKESRFPTVAVVATGFGADSEQGVDFGAVPSKELELLLTVIDQAFDRKSWHGTNLRGSLRGVTYSEASWRPSPERHNIWELALHAAYWKYAVRRRLLGEPRGSFPHAGSDWFPRPDGRTAVDWKRDVRLLGETHRSMRDAIAGLRASDLHVVPASSEVSNLALVSGVAAHDLYHAGQIQLLKRLGAKSA